MKTLMVLVLISIIQGYKHSAVKWACPVGRCYRWCEKAEVKWQVVKGQFWCFKWHLKRQWGWQDLHAMQCSSSSIKVHGFDFNPIWRELWRWEIACLDKFQLDAVSHLLHCSSSLQSLRLTFCSNVVFWIHIILVMHNVFWQHPVSKCRQMWW